MSRPKKDRIVSQPPLFSEFKPSGVPGNMLEDELLELDEFEALRLTDYLGLDHIEAAEEMEISRPTFTRLIESARRKVAEFIVEGRRLQIEGGQIHFRGNLVRCNACGEVMRAGFGRPIAACTACGSTNLSDLAGGFGHGSCCRGHNRHGRR